MNALRETEIRMSQRTFIVISTPTTEHLVKEAVEALKAMGDVEIQQCPELFSEWYQCPAVKIPSGRMIFGIDGIRMFVERELASEAQSGMRAGQSF